MKTHLVIDLHYHEEEGNIEFAGTLEECQEHLSEQTPYFMYKIVPMTKQEHEVYNS